MSFDLLKNLNDQLHLDHPYCRTHSTDGPDFRPYAPYRRVCARANTFKTGNWEKNDRETLKEKKNRGLT